MLIIDASAAIQCCLSMDGFDGLAGHDLTAPPLLWSESSSVVHELFWRDEISGDLAGIAMGRLRSAPIRRKSPRRLLVEAWRIADDFGWAKTYDAEYVALAALQNCPLLTIDGRLQRTASRVIEVLGPADL